ncbi:MAG: hypothetical protein K6U80_09975 [Firmicutes bacterium]|nr:hypothetical protein [Bacillota bacterium]
MKKETIVLLVLCILVISISVISAKGLIIDEKVSYKEYTCDRSIPFNIPQKGKLQLNIEYKIKKGKCMIAILNPEDKVVFQEGGENFQSVDTTIPVYKGTWHLSIKCDGIDSTYAVDGYYKITGKFKK